MQLQLRVHLLQRLLHRLLQSLHLLQLLQLLLQPFLLESPRWYAMYGNEPMAEEMLVLLRDMPPDDEEVQAELFCMLSAPSSHLTFPHRLPSPLRCAARATLGPHGAAAAASDGAARGHGARRARLPPTESAVARRRPPRTRRRAAAHPWGCGRVKFSCW